VTRLLLTLFLAGCAKPADLVALGRNADGTEVAVVVDDHRIRAVVTAARVARFVGEGTTRLEGDYVTPGFVDGHGHPGWLAQLASQVDLAGAATYAETLARIEAFAARTPGPVTGHGWDQTDWPDAPPGGWPLASDLERVAPGRTVALTRIDGHAMWVSEDLLAVEDVDGGTVVRDAGRPTGVLVDAAMAQVTVPEAELTASAVQETLAGLARDGLVGVHAMWVTDAEVVLYTQLADTLPIRLWLYVGAETEAAERLLREGPWRVGRVSVVGIKVFADGALGSRGAWLHEPYHDAPSERGLPQADLAELEDLTTRALQRGVQLAVHAIGDAAIDATLDAYSAARGRVRAPNTPLRVEHVQVLSPEALSRFREAGAVASMQPTHATSDSPWAEDRLGPDRVARAYAWRDVVDAGIRLVFGSDFPVESPDPGLGIAAAVDRGGWTTSQALTLPETVRAFTSGPAAVVGERLLGELAPGYTADLTLWRVVDGQWSAVATVVDGEPVR
jgi:predicted amidohydrolase YtcJ